MQPASFIKRLIQIVLSVVILSACAGELENTDQEIISSATPASEGPENSMLGNKWAMVLGGSYTDAATRLLATSDGGVLIVGKTKSVGAGNTDGVVIRLAADNTILWAHIFGGTKDDSFSSAGQLSDGSFVLAGSTQSFDEKIGDAWLVKTDSAGNIIWQKTLGGKADDFVSDLKITPSDEILLIGTTESYGGGWQDIWASKVDINGNAVWQKVFYTGSSDYGNTLILMGNDDAILSGGGANDNTDIFTIKIDVDNGEIIWKKAYSLDGNQTATSLISTTDGGFLLAGFSFVPGETTDGLLMKINPDGNTVWENIIGTSQDDAYFSSAVSTQNGYVVAGQTDSFGNGGYDAWLMEVDEEGNVKQQLFFGDRDDDHFSSIVATDASKVFVAGNTLSFQSNASDILTLKLDEDLAMAGCTYCGDTFAFALPQESSSTDWTNLQSDVAGFVEADSSGIMTDFTRQIQTRVLWNSDSQSQIQNEISATADAFQSMATATAQAYYDNRARATATAQVYRSQVVSMTQKEVLTVWNSILNETFIDNAHNWATGDVDNDYWIGNRSVPDGKYLWDVEYAKQGLVSGYSPDEDAKLADFFASVEVQMQGAQNSCAGLRFRGDGSNYYFFRICASGYYQLSSHSQDGGWDTLIDWTRSDFIQPNQWNRLAVMAEGTILIFTSMIN